MNRDGGEETGTVTSEIGFLKSQEYYRSSFLYAARGEPEDVLGCVPCN
jgi:hypothetical protein